MTLPVLPFLLMVCSTHAHAHAQAASQQRSRTMHARTLACTSYASAHVDAHAQIHTCSVHAHKHMHALHALTCTIFGHSQTGKLIVTVSPDRTMRIYETSTFKEKSPKYVMVLMILSFVLYSLPCPSFPSSSVSQFPSSCLPLSLPPPQILPAANAVRPRYSSVLES